MPVTPRTRAALITLVLLWQAIEAIPKPPRLTPERLQEPVVRDNLRAWVGALDAVGVHTDEGELGQRAMVEFDRIRAAHQSWEAITWPIDRAFRPTQSFSLFGSPGARPYQLQIHGRTGERDWQPLYLSGSTDANLLEPALIYRRVRGLYKPRMRRPPNWRRFVDWVGERMFELTEHDEVRVQITRPETRMPGQTAPHRPRAFYARKRQR